MACRGSWEKKRPVVEVLYKTAFLSRGALKTICCASSNCCNVIQNSKTSLVYPECASRNIIAATCLSHDAHDLISVFLADERVATQKNPDGGLGSTM